MKIRFPFTPPTDLNSTSGPTVLVSAMTEALRHDARFADLNEVLWGPDDVPWYPVGHCQIAQRIATGQPFAIGPNTLYGLSYRPGAYAGEREMMAYENFAAIFCLSRWYSELCRKTMKQQTRHFLVDYPLPTVWTQMSIGNMVAPRYKAFIFQKGGPIEQAIVVSLLTRIGAVPVIKYGAYNRQELFNAAAQSECCLYVSHEDNYPLAAVEIGLMGCPIVSDERSCPVVVHGLTGVIVPVRERGESEPFTWSPDTAERLIVGMNLAQHLSRKSIRERTLARHDPSFFAEKVWQCINR